MLNFILKRLVHMIPTAFGVVTFTFLLLHLTPGDPIEVLLGDNALQADRAALAHALGLDLPLWKQYIQFLGQLIQFDLGTSFYSGEPVSQMILSRLPATAHLALGASIFALVVALPLGFFSATHKGAWPDKYTLGFSMLGFSMPSFWVGPLLMIFFSLWLGVLPVSGNDEPLGIILPSITLGLAMAAILARLLRASLLEALSSPYIQTAHAKGLGYYSIVLRHAFSNALLPVLTLLFLQMGALLTGAILTEAVFSWPGVGSLIVDALHQRDYPLIQGCVLFISFVYMAMTLVSDIVCALCDPRVRRSAGEDGA